MLQTKTRGDRNGYVAEKWPEKVGIRDVFKAEETTHSALYIKPQ